MRFAPSIDIIRELQSQGARVRAYDPQAMPRAARLLPGVEFCSSAEETAQSADLVALLTDWPEFSRMDLTSFKARMRLPIFCDGRNLFDRKEMEKLGYTYLGVGC